MQVTFWFLKNHERKVLVVFVFRRCLGVAPEKCDICKNGIPLNDLARIPAQNFGSEFRHNIRAKIPASNFGTKFRGENFARYSGPKFHKQRPRQKQRQR